MNHGIEQSYPLTSGIVDVDALRLEAKRLRTLLHCSQSDLGREIGASQSAVSAFERGVNDAMRKDALHRLIRQVEAWRAAIKAESNVIRLPGSTGHAHLRPGLPTAPGEASAPAWLEAASPVICDRCGQRVPGTRVGARYCIRCGERIRAVCPSCGHLSRDPEAKFCSQCGKQLSSE